MRLVQSCSAWDTQEFETVLKREVQSLSAKELWLQQALSQSSYVSDSPFSLVVLSTAGDDVTITVKIGVFYTGFIAGSCCADDPSALTEVNEYCELLLHINRVTAETDIQLL